ncbi:DUF3558 family protein [Antrihabitans sp. YC3-6]|uniref:DUF3558 family protein n=1 Tax=Antrihabitans stalagmiti TaxID=2799499 RepID=A0A934NPN5_9NOCA|nr:DUF3558 family protein [Antrihabitans stalagmiti]MBJ8339010.1 DUF3558 family protein [Antrihabitans stalagmiti]
MSTQRRIIAACASVLALAGCTTSVAGTPAAKSSPQVAYASKLSPKDQATLAYFAELRKLDPCAFLDEATLKDLGTVREFAGDAYSAACNAKVEVDRSSNKSLEISIQLVSKDNGFTTGAETITVDDTAVEQKVEYKPGESSASINTCRNLVAFDGDYSVLISVFRRTSDAACAEANQLIAQTIPLLDTRPQREDSGKRKSNTATAVLDPCEALGRLSEDADVALTESTQPWGCRFTVDGADGSIQYSVNSNDGYEKPYDGERIDIDGHDAVRTQYGDTCSVEVWAGYPKGNFDPVDSDYIATTVRVSSDDCDSVENTAEIAVGAYLDR